MFLNQQLWAIYHMALKRESIRTLLLYDDGWRETDLSYKFIIICTNPMNFFKNLGWIEEIDKVEHIEREHSFYQNSEIFFNSCVIFKTGWSCQFIFIENKRETIFLKQSNIVVFIDRDQLIKSEQIRLDAIKSGQWHELPKETELEEIITDFYENALHLCHLYKQQLKHNLLMKQKEPLDRTIIYLLQWLNFLGECFYEDELKKISHLIDVPVMTNKPITFQLILEYIEAVDYLALLYLKCMNYQLESAKSMILKDYINYMINQETNDVKGNKLAIFRVS